MWGRKNFYFGDNISVGVKDLDLAVAWYQEKLGLRLTPLKSEDFEAFLAFAKDGQTGLRSWLFRQGRPRRTSKDTLFSSRRKLRQLTRRLRQKE